MGERRDRRRILGDRPLPGEARLLDENLKLRATIGEMTLRIAELERIADSDTLTPLPNRRVFERELERTMARVARYGTGAALLFVDLDGLKRINDFHGHAAGDMALIHVAALLRDNVRAVDVAARLGGDEFGVILAEVTEEQAREKAAALSALIALSPLPNGIRLSASIGVTALVPSDDGVGALGRADGDMYRVKGEK